jgi:hypothetical protein
MGTKTTKIAKFPNQIQIIKQEKQKQKHDNCKIKIQ